MKKPSAEEFVTGIEAAVAHSSVHIPPVDIKRLRRLKRALAIWDWDIDDALGTLQWLIDNKHRWRKES